MKSYGPYILADYLPEFQTFKQGKAENYYFMHCPFDGEHGLTCKIVRDEYYFCHSCGETGTFFSIKNYIKKNYKMNLEDFFDGNFDIEGFRKGRGVAKKDRGTVHERRYKKEIGYQDQIR